MLDCDADAEDGAEGCVAGSAPVEAEDELVEVGLQVLASEAVVDAQRPGLEVGEDAMNPGQDHMGTCGSCRTRRGSRPKVGAQEGVQAVGGERSAPGGSGRAHPDLDTGATIAEQPCGLVGTQAEASGCSAEIPLECASDSDQRQAVHHRTGRHRGLLATVGAFMGVCLGRERPPPAAAAGRNEACRPAQDGQVGSAGIRPTSPHFVVPDAQGPFAPYTRCSPPSATSGIKTGKPCIWKFHIAQTIPIPNGTLAHMPF